MDGVELGRVIQQKWHGAVDYIIVLEQQRAGNLPAMRIQGQVDGLLEIIHDEGKIVTVDSDQGADCRLRAEMWTLDSPVVGQLPIVQRFMASILSVLRWIFWMENRLRQPSI